MSEHTIKCKWNGRAICIRLGGGWCICPSTDKCAMRREWENEEQIRLNIDFQKDFLEDKEGTYR
jgi:hypothetical protein